MKTVTNWVNGIVTDKAKLAHWLSRQFVGEMLAAQRVQKLSTKVSGKLKPVIERIAKDEAVHAGWVKSLLVSRNLPIPEVTYDDDRYWKTVFKGVNESIPNVLALGAHAEKMRLHRIKAIVGDTRFDEDIRAVFSKILPDEEFHAKAFSAAAGKNALERTRENHELGLKVLGLEI